MSTSAFVMKLLRDNGFKMFGGKNTDREEDFWFEPFNDYMAALPYQLIELRGGYILCPFNTTKIRIFVNGSYNPHAWLTDEVVFEIDLSKPDADPRIIVAVAKDIGELHSMVKAKCSKEQILAFRKLIQRTQGVIDE